MMIIIMILFMGVADRSSSYLITYLITYNLVWAFESIGSIVFPLWQLTIMFTACNILRVVALLSIISYWHTPEGKRVNLFNALYSLKQNASLSINMRIMTIPCTPSHLRCHTPFCQLPFSTLSSPISTFLFPLSTFCFTLSY